MSEKDEKLPEELRRKAIRRTVEKSPKYAMAKAQWLPKILALYQDRWDTYKGHWDVFEYARAGYPDVTNALKDIMENEKGSCKIQEQLFFSKLAELTDPTMDRKAGKECKFLHWICKNLIEDPMPVEDLYRLRERLNHFEQISGQLHKDGKPNQISQIEGFEQLAEIMRPYEAEKMRKDADSALRRMSSEDKARLKKESTILYDGPEGRIVMPHSIWASQYWGNQTKWCISARAEKDNMFNTYDREDPVIIYLPKPSAEDLQTHPNYASFKFASVYRLIYNEWDYYDVVGKFNYPDCLKRLARAVADNGFIRKHGNIHQILEDVEIMQDPLTTYSRAPDAEKNDWAFFFKCYEDSWLLMGAACDRFWKKDVPSHLLDDPEFALRVVEVNPYDIRHFPALVQSNLDVCIAAGKRNKATNCDLKVRGAMQKLLQNPQIIKNTALGKQGLTSLFLSILKSDAANIERQLAQKIINGGYGFCPFLVPKSLLQDKEYCLAALEASKRAGTTENMMDDLRRIPDLQGDAQAVTSVHAAIEKIHQDVKKPPQPMPQRSLKL